jgi:hypothetical protein
MATKPDDDRTAEKIIAAALLVGALYSLPAMIARARVRPRPFRQIKPTEGLRSSMAAPFVLIVRAWQAERAAIMGAYETARATGDASTLLRAIDAAGERIAVAVTTAQARLPDAAAHVEQWHRGQWIQRIKAATGLDVSHLTGAREVRNDIEDTVAWARRLADDVSRKVKNDLTSGLLGDLAARKPATSASSTATDVLAKAKRRSLGIGVDQTDKLVTAMGRSRRRAAGIDRFRWHHTPHLRFPRPDHVARDNRVYSERNAPNDRAGTLWGCQCWEEPLFDQP